MTGPLLRLTPLYGDAAGPRAALLTIGPVTVLLDAGWVDPFDVAVLDPLLR